MSSRTARLSCYATAAAAMPSAAFAGTFTISGLGADQYLAAGSAPGEYTLSFGGVDLKFLLANNYANLNFWVVSAGENGAVVALLSTQGGNSGFLSRFAYGRTLSAATSKPNGVGFSAPNGGNSVGQWAGEDVATGYTGYIGFFSNASDPSTKRTGWVEVTWSWNQGTGDGHLTIGSYSIGAVGESMQAGVPAVPGLSGLAALACGAAGVRRSRKRTA